MFSRLSGKLVPFSRSFSAAGPSATAGEHAGGVKLWKLLSFVVAIPGVGVCFINANLKEKEHHEHLKHHKPEFIPYAHMYQRTKKFPWGDGNHSLFHNPEVNALPDGYESSES